MDGTDEEHLRPEQVPKLRTYLRDFPILEGLYDFKQELTAIMRLKKITARAAKRAIPDFLFAIECLMDTPIPTLLWRRHRCDQADQKVIRLEDQRARAVAAPDRRQVFGRTVTRPGAPLAELDATARAALERQQAHRTDAALGGLWVADRAAHCAGGQPAPCSSEGAR